MGNLPSLLEMVWTLVAGAATALAAGACYALVAWQTARPAALFGDRVAGRAYAMWWGALACLGALNAAVGLAAAAGVRDVRVFLAWRYATLPLVAAAMWGLTTHFLYLVTGRLRGSAAAAVAYAALAGATAWLVARAHTVAVSVGTWRADLAYDGGGGLQPVIATLFLAPALVLAAGYVRIARAAPDAASRRRAQAVGLAVFAWTLGTIVARLAEPDLAMVLARDGLGIVTVWLVLRAQAPRERPLRPTRRDDDLHRRIAQLV